MHQQLEQARDPAGNHALLARAQKRAAAELIGVTDELVDTMVEQFYTRIRKDALLGPIFAGAISDWQPHLARMKAFWRSILFNSGEFSGNPVAKHRAIDGLELAHFSHWLDLFYQTLRELDCGEEAVELIGGRARMIADSLLTSIAMERDGLKGARAGEDLPHA